MKKIWLLIFLVLTGCSTIRSPLESANPTSLPTIDPGSVSEAILKEAEDLASESGISTDEALRRILMMEASGELNAMLEAKEAETFAGMWLLHQPEFKVVVAFTQNGERTLQPYVQNTILAGFTEVREAEVSQAELIRIERETNQLVNQLGLSLVAITLVNIQENQVEVHIPDRSLLDNKLATSQLVLPDHVMVIIPQDVSTDGMLPNLTPAPGVYFPQLIAPPALVYAISVNGKLILKDGCLRLESAEGNLDQLLVWRPNHSLNNNQGILEVLDQSGGAVARVGELSCFSPAAGEISGNDSDLLRDPLPDACDGPNFLVGQVELAYQEGVETSLVEAELVNLEGDDIYLIHAKADLEGWLEEPSTLSGKLVRSEGSRCLRIHRTGRNSFEDYLVFWPPEYTFQVESGNIAIINQHGAVVAYLNQETHFHGSLVKAVEEVRIPLIQELPCDCVGGDYWLVLDSSDNN